MRTERYTLENARDFVGKQVGLSEWFAVTQQHIDEFAELTGDAQWIHVDAARAATSQFHSTVAHGLMCLAWTYKMAEQAKAFPEGAHMCVNYGYDQLRFPAPVKPGQRIRTRVELTNVQERGPAELLLTHKYTVEIQGETKPALVCDCLGLFYRA